MLRRACWFGLIIGIAIHFIHNLVFGPPLPIPLVYYYAVAIFLTPAAFPTALALNACIPQYIAMKPRRILRGSDSLNISSDRLMRWRFVVRPREQNDVPPLAWVALRYRNIKGKRRTWIVGIAPHVDLRDVDRMLRRFQRLSNRAAGTPHA